MAEGPVEPVDCFPGQWVDCQRLPIPSDLPHVLVRCKDWGMPARTRRDPDFDGHSLGMFPATHFARSIEMGVERGMGGQGSHFARSSEMGGFKQNVSGGT